MWLIGAHLFDVCSLIEFASLICIRLFIIIFRFLIHFLLLVHNMTTEKLICSIKMSHFLFHSFEPISEMIKQSVNLSGVKYMQAICTILMSRQKKKTPNLHNLTLNEHNFLDIKTDVTSDRVML